MTYEKGETRSPSGLSKARSRPESLHGGRLFHARSWKRCAAGKHLRRKALATALGLHTVRGSRCSIFIEIEGITLSDPILIFFVGDVDRWSMM